MSPPARCLILLLSLSAGAEAQATQPEVGALMLRARLTGTAISSCAGEFRPGHRGAYAIALSETTERGHYVILEADATVTELSGFKGAADLSCLSRAQAKDLDAAIAQSETIEGGVSPRFETTVVCGFVNDVEAVCWQYSPSDRRFVRIGGWIT